MSDIVIISLVIVALAAVAVSYVVGYFKGAASVEHPDGPETCRAKLRAAETVGQMWRARALEREEQVKQLQREKAEHADAETRTVTMLLEELDELAGAAPRIEALA